MPKRERYEKSLTADCAHAPCSPWQLDMLLLLRSRRRNLLSGCRLLPVCSSLLELKLSSSRLLCGRRSPRLSMLLWDRSTRRSLLLMVLLLLLLL